jgi:predicted TIM-barrel fold metal-dependent hydrolase
MTSSSYDLISADSHVIEPSDLFETRVPAGLRGRAPKVQSLNGGSAWAVDGTEPVPLPPSAASGSGYSFFDREPAPITFDDVLPGLYDPAERVKAQVADSLDAEVLYPSPDLWDAINESDDAELKLACVRAYNDWIAEFCAYNPDRLVGIGKIPTTGIEDAHEELVRCIEELHLRGVVLDAWPDAGAKTGDPAQDPFWNTANDAGVPVSMHIAIGAGAITAPPSGIAPGLKPAMADTALPLAATGVFDRFPELKLVFAHADAGWSIHWLEFLDINYVRMRHLEQYKLPNPDLLPSEYARAHVWFTFHYDRTAVKNRHRIGPSHLMWSSHFPLEDANWPDDRQEAMRMTEEVSADDRHALLAGNTARLYRLPGYEEGFTSSGAAKFEPLVHF